MYLLSPATKTKLPASGFYLLVLMFLFTKPLYAAQFFVTNTADTDGTVCETECTLRQAINAANGSSGSDIIDLSGIAGTIILNSALPAITESVEIVGPGADILTVDANSKARVFKFEGANSGQTEKITGLTMTGGSDIDGGGIWTSANDSLTLDKCAVIGNTASGYGGGLWYAGDLTVTQSLVANNTATTDGGGLFASGIPSFAMENSTISGNTNSGISIDGTSSIKYSTIANNGSYGLNKLGGTVSVKNTIIAGNTTNCNIDLSIPNNYNLSDVASCGFTGANDINADPLLGPLAYNGGSTQTHGLLYNSPAIDTADPMCPGDSIDQTAKTRNAGIHCDIGAYEAPIAADISVSQSVAAGSYNPGDELTYTIVVHDSGPGDAQNIVLTDILDANVSYVSSTPENCTETIGVVTCQLADIVNGTERTLTIVVQINDGGTLTNSVTVIANGGNDPDDSNNKNITLDTSVNAKPVANAGSFSTDEDIAYNGTLTGTDGDNDALTFSIANSGSKGTVTLSDASTGAFSYTPKTNANGTDSFTFKVNDGQIDSATAAVTITINAINDAPMANSGTLAVTPGSVKYSALSATDLDGDQLSYSIVANGSKGTATVINSATGEFSYTPNAGETGTDEFTFKVSDGSTDSNTATIKVTISTASTEQTNNAGNSNGGGGAFDLMLILMLSSLSILRSLVYNRNTNV